MEDLFKFIPIALWLLYKLVGSGKSKEQKPKQRKKPASRPQTTKKTPSLEEILRELSGEQKPKPSPKPAPVQRQSLADERKKIDIVDHQYDFRPEYEHHADTGEDIADIKEKIRREKFKEEEVVEAEIDIRQAVIYDTILNRPSY
ncbi:MAG: hypothetical protein ACPGTP_08185 [Bacteroidia bacterium]